nr:hypothetical protein [Candidatus Sigynarchaeota archaeon]
MASGAAGDRGGEKAGGRRGATIRTNWNGEETSNKAFHEARAAIVQPGHQKTLGAPVTVATTISLAGPGSRIQVPPFQPERGPSRDLPGHLGEPASPGRLGSNPNCCHF